MKILIPIFMMGIVGCADIAAMTMVTKSSEKLMEEDLITLCNSYAVTKDKKVLRVIEQKAEFTKEEWQAISNREIFIGMSEAAAVCSLYTGSCTKVITRQSSNGIVKEYVFGETSYFHPFCGMDIFAVVQDGVIVTMARQEE